ncbi:MAG: hypothetical protein KAH56_11650 [Candidatus Krumholzibacteria bacterium]|nr:hypothetical protein [Candidatus Krumholzibacteria bacterium]
MNTGLKNQHRLMIITVVAGLILAAIAFLKPAQAEARVVVRARVGAVGIAVSPDSPRGVIVQTGPRSYRCDIRVRPARPLRGHYVWVPGHYETTIIKKNCRKIHKRGRIVFRHHRAHRHNHYRDIWVPGHWERV